LRNRIDFEASFTLGSRGLPGDPGAVLHFRTVRVHTGEPPGRLREVAEITERRYPVRSLLTAASVGLEMTWTAVSEEVAQP
jgi:hypothetical protein